MKISLIGCDNCTIVDINVDDIELAFLKRLQRAAEAESNSDCQPVIRFGDNADRLHLRFPIEVPRE